MRHGRNWNGDRFLFDNIILMKTHKEIIQQYYPDGSGYGGTHYNENKIIRMIEQAIKIDRLNNSRFTPDDVIQFARSNGVNCDIRDLIQWINETT